MLAMCITFACTDLQSVNAKYFQKDHFLDLLELERVDALVLYINIQL